MKTPTIQVHRNGAAKAAKSQAKTSRRKPKNVRIVINDEAGKVFADFEISKAMHLAIERDSKAKGISPMCWIEDAVRGYLKKFTPSEPSPAATSPQPVPEMLIPSEIVIECKDALSLLGETGGAACALLMLNADLIRESYKANDGWQPFEVPRFGEGVQELARMTACEFNSVLKELSGYMGDIFSQIEGSNEPIKTVSRNVYYGLLEGRAGKKAKFGIENVIGSLMHCIELQSTVLAARNSDGAYHLGALTKDRLDAEFQSIWTAIGKLEGAYLATAVQYDPAGTERRMAA